TEASTPVPGSSRPQVALLSRSFAFILLVYMFAGFAYQGGLTFLPRFVGAGFFALALALGAIGQVLSGRLADRRRFERILFALSVAADRKSTRLNSSHVSISYAVFCLK